MTSKLKRISTVIVMSSNIITINLASCLYYCSVLRAFFIKTNRVQIGEIILICTSIRINITIIVIKSEKLLLNIKNEQCYY